MSSDIEHWQINATVFKDRVEEIHYVSDPLRNVRRRPQTKIWQVERFLGRGGFGEVRLERNSDGQARAVKRIPTTSTALSNSECVKELKALLEFSKPKSREAAVFVDFFGWFKDGSDMFLAMEYVQLGDLEKNVSGNPGRIPVVEARDIAEQILSGLAIMHAESFAHRDLKPQNVLVVHGPPRWWIKLADFGLSKRLTDTTAFYTRGGTQSYMAPEILNFITSEITSAIDIWAAGCIIYRLIAGAVPFPPGPALMKYCEDASKFPQNVLFEQEVEDSGSSFIKKLLAAHPQDRLSAAEALRCEWLASVYATTSDTMVSVISNKSRSSIIQLPETSQSTVSDMTYNTASHEGLKSHQRLLDSEYSNISPYSVPSSSKTTTTLKSGSLTIKRKSLSLLNAPTQYTPRTISRGGTDASNSSVVSQEVEIKHNNTANFYPQQKSTHHFPSPIETSDLGHQVSDLTGRLSNLREFSRPDRINRLSPLEEPSTSANPTVIRKPEALSSVGVVQANPNASKSIASQVVQDSASLLQLPNLPYETTVTLASELSITPSSARAPQVISHVKAIHDFHGTGAPDELVFLKGAIIEICEPVAGGSRSQHEGWWRGRIGDRTGVFPMTNVEIALSGVKGQSENFVFRVRALYDFIPSEDGELVFKKGEVIFLLDSVYKDWWTGMIGSRRGMVPVNYVEVFPVPTSAELFLGKITHVKTLFYFSPTEAGQLAFRKGDVIRLISPRFEGWWLGELHGKEGIFPLSHVEVVANTVLEDTTTDWMTQTRPTPASAQNLYGRPPRLVTGTVSNPSFLVIVHGAMGIQAFGDPAYNFLSCQILLDGRLIHATRGKTSATCDPSWNESFLVRVDDTIQKKRLKFVVICDCFRYESLGEFMGEAYLELGIENSYEPVNTTLRLKAPSGKSFVDKGSIETTFQLLPPGKDMNSANPTGD